jgi:cytochrome c-type biogenesis protein CcmH
MLRQGKSEKEVIDYLVQRYGDFVLYRPPVKATTGLLWGGPFILLLAGLAGLFINLKRRRQQSAEPLSEADRTVAAQLLHGNLEGLK